VTVGFRQMVKYSFYDSLYDVDLAFKKCIKIIPAYGGDTTEMVIMTWSGGSNLGFAAITQDRTFYNEHIKLLVSVSTPFQLESFEKKVVQSILDHPFEAHHVYQYHYLGQGPLAQRLEFICGCKSQEFPFVYRQNIEWAQRLKDLGFDTDLYVLENYDHYDATITIDFVVSRIR
jgi:hypothetical protein